MNTVFKLIDPFLLLVFFSDTLLYPCKVASHSKDKNLKQVQKPRQNNSHHHESQSNNPLTARGWSEKLRFCLERGSRPNEKLRAWRWHVLQKDTQKLGAKSSHKADKQKFESSQWRETALNWTYWQEHSGGHKHPHPQREMKKDARPGDERRNICTCWQTSLDHATNRRGVGTDKGKPKPLSWSIHSLQIPMSYVISSTTASVVHASKLEGVIW